MVDELRGGKLESPPLRSSTFLTAFFESVGTRTAYIVSSFTALVFYNNSCQQICLTFVGTEGFARGATYLLVKVPVPGA